MGIAERYARAVFDLAREGDGPDAAREGGALDALGRDVDALDGAIRDSSDLREMLGSPVVARSEGEAAIGAIADGLGLGDVMGNTLRLMAQKRRLFAVPALVARLREMLAEARGEVAAEVRAAKALTPQQEKDLSEALRASTGKDVRLDVTVDEALIGGLVVKVGSRMIDTSIRAKLDALRNTMREAR